MPVTQATEAGKKERMPSVTKNKKRTPSAPKGKARKLRESSPTENFFIDMFKWNSTLGISYLSV
jgi:hypothetical protein